MLLFGVYCSLIATNYRGSRVFHTGLMGVDGGVMVVKKWWFRGDTNKTNWNVTDAPLLSSSSLDLWSIVSSQGTRIVDLVSIK